MPFTPLYSARPTKIRNSTDGRFIAMGPKQHVEVLAGAGVSKRVMSNTELQRRKKLQSHIAVTTSTLGLAALGMKGGAVATAGRAKKLTKLAGVTHGPNAAVHEFHAHNLNNRAKQLNNAAINTGIISSGIGGVGGYNFASYTKAESNQRIKKSLGSAMDFGLGGVQQGEEISKKDWMNISEHERRSRDSRRTHRRAANVAGYGGAAIVGAHLHQSLAAPHKPNYVRQGLNITGSTKNVASAQWKMRGVKGPFAQKARSNNFKALGRVVRRNPHGAVGLAGATTMAGGVGVMAGARANEKRHDRAIARQRKARVIEKAYDPERNRRRRLDHWSTASAVGAGALGTGALVQTKKATPGLKRIVHTKYGRSALGHAGGAAALTTGAVALAVGSDRIRSYKKGRGGSYTPLHTISY